MKLRKKRKGNNLVEYGLIVALIGIALGFSLKQMDMDVFKAVFMGSIASNSQESEDNIITIAPLSE